MRDVRRNGGGSGCVGGGGAGKRVDEVNLGRPQSFRHQRRPVDDCSPGRGGMTQNGGTRGGTFHGEMDCCFVFVLMLSVEAAALCSIVLRYAGAPIATRIPLSFWLFGDVAFSEYFLYHCRFLFV